MAARHAHRPASDDPAEPDSIRILPPVEPRRVVDPIACQPLAAFRARLYDFARELGFYGGRYVHIGHAIPSLDAAHSGPPRRFLSTSIREAAAQAALGWLACDPSATLILAAHVPFPWTTRIDDRLTATQRAWLAAQRANGVSAGIAIPVQDYSAGPAYLSLFGVDESAAARLCETRAADLSYAAATFHAAAKSALGEDGNAEKAAMSGREIAVLRLAALGKTVPESARALGIHFRTVEYHLKSASEKLGATSKLRAVAVAVRRGLIDV